MTSKNLFKTLRMISSFALLGAVMAGSIFGWGDTSADSARTVGAVVGAFAGTWIKFHIL